MAMTKLNDVQVRFQQDGSTTIRTIGEKAKEWVSVKDFGAKGDYNPITETGTDDRNAIQAAFDAAAANPNIKTVYFPAGIYWISGSSAALLVKSNITILGSGMGSSIIKRDDWFTTGGGRKDILICDRDTYPDVTSCTVRDITFEGTFEKRGYINPGDQYIASFTSGKPSELTNNTIVSSTSNSITIATPLQDKPWVGFNILLENANSVSEFEILSVNAARTTITLVDTNTTVLNPTHFHVARGARGMGARFVGLDFLFMEGVEFKHIRMFAAAITNCRNVTINACRLYKIARDGFSLRRCSNVVVTNNVIQYTGDDSICNSFEGLDALDNTYQTQKTIIANNVLEDCNGIYLQSPNDVKIENNLLNRCMRAISFSRNTNVLNTNSRLTISNNTLVDPLSRNAIIYGLSHVNGQAGAIELQYIAASNTGVALDLENFNYFHPPIVPEPLYQYSEKSTTVRPAFGNNITISDNQIVRRIPDGELVRTYNDKGVFYGRKCLTNVTEYGFHRDITVNRNVLHQTGITLVNVAEVNINNNKISGLTAGIVLKENPSTSTGGDGLGLIAFPHITITNNHIFRMTNYGILFMRSGAASKSDYFDMPTTIISNNVIDMDPLFESPARETSGGLFTGGWTSGSYDAAPFAVCASSSSGSGRGLVATNNHIRNTSRVYNSLLTNNFRGNLVYSQFTNSTGDDVTNLGVRYLAPARVGETDIVYCVSNPNDANYGVLQNATSAASEAAFKGVFLQKGRFVKNQNPVVTGTTPNRYIVDGWVRLTDGTGGTEFTNWVKNITRIE